MNRKRDSCGLCRIIRERLTDCHIREILLFFVLIIAIVLESEKEKTSYGKERTDILQTG